MPQQGVTRERLIDGAVRAFAKAVGRGDFSAAEKLLRVALFLAAAQEPRR